MSLSAYQYLKTQFAHITHMRNMENILSRDSSFAMPAGAVQDRMHHFATLNAQIHQILIDPHLQDSVDQARAYFEADQMFNNGEDLQFHLANIRLMQRDITHATALPAGLVDQLARLAGIGQHAHAQWRADNDWAAMQAHLDQMLPFIREKAQLLHDALNLGDDRPIYDALIDEFDPYGSCDQITSIFAPIQSFILDNLQAACAKSNERLAAVMGEAGDEALRLPHNLTQSQHGHFLRDIAAKMGFDFQRGVMVLSNIHPSCYASWDDARFCVPPDEKGFVTPLNTTMHEAGHGIYEQNLNASFAYQPVARSCGMSLHESQALFWERQIGGQQPWLQYIAGIVPGYYDLPGDHMRVNAQYLIAQNRHVTPSLIRISADEMTYPLHIFLRFDLEKSLISGDINPADIPAIWNDKMQDVFGITPPDFAHGCLQDIHWAAGSFGYFPSYVMGAVMAAQFMAKMQADIPDIHAQLQDGQCEAIRQWLSTHIHQYGSRFKSMDLVQHVTKKPLSADDFITHLSQSYL